MNTPIFAYAPDGSFATSFTSIDACRRWAGVGRDLVGIALKDGRPVANHRLMRRMHESIKPWGIEILDRFGGKTYHAATPTHAMEVLNSMGSRITSAATVRNALNNGAIVSKRWELRRL